MTVPVDSYTWHLPELVMNVRQVKVAVEGLLGRRVGRTTLYRWRCQLNFREPPYFKDHAIALAVYGSFLKANCPPNEAKARTIEVMKENRNNGCS